MRIVAHLRFVLRYSRSGSVTLLLLLMLCCVSLYAQRVGPDTLRDVNVTSSSLLKIHSITPVQEVASADFKRYNAFNVADAIRNFSGVNIKDYGGIGGLKTVSVRSLGANQTAILYDGVQVTDAQNGQVDLGKINLDNIEQIVLYNGQPSDICQPARSYTAASVIIINSIRPKLTAEKPYKASAGYKTGSFGLINPYATGQFRINDRWSATASANWQKANGRYKFKVDGDGSDTLANRTNADLNSLQTDASVFWAKSDSNRLQVRVNYYRSDRGLPGAVVFYNPYSAQRLWNDDLFGQITYNHVWKSSIQLLLNTKVSKNYVRYNDPDFLNEARNLDQRYNQKEFYQSVAVAYQPLPNLQVSYSGDIAVNTLRTNLYQYSYPTRYTWLNVFASKLSAGRFVFQGSVLNTSINEHVQTGVAAPSRSVWSPTIAATFNPFSRSGLQLRAFYKDIFRNPTFNDLYYTRIGNRDLKPEYAKQYDVGITIGKAYTGILNYITVSADAYYNTVRNKIIAIPNKDLFTWSMMNLGMVDIRGIDASLRSELKLNDSTKGLFSFSYTFQDAVDVTDNTSSVYLNQVPYTPKNTFAFNGGLQFSKLAIFYNQVISSSRYYLGENIPANYVPGFSVSDMSATYNVNHGRFPVLLSAEVNNIFNTSYAFIRSFPMPGRSVRFTFQITI